MKKIKHKGKIHFEEVLSLVKQGLTEKEAICRFYKGTSYFYQKATKEQKEKLREAKVASRKLHESWGRDITPCFDDDMFI